MNSARHLMRVSKADPIPPYLSWDLGSGLACTEDPAFDLTPHYYSSVAGGYQATSGQFSRFTMPYDIAEMDLIFSGNGAFTFSIDLTVNTQIQAGKSVGFFFVNGIFARLRVIDASTVFFEIFWFGKNASSNPNYRALSIPASSVNVAGKTSTIVLNCQLISNNGFSDFNAWVDREQTAPNGQQYQNIGSHPVDRNTFIWMSYMFSNSQYISHNSTVASLKLWNGFYTHDELEKAGEI